MAGTGTGASVKSPPSSGSAQATPGAGGLAALCEDDWDNEEWGTLQEEPVSLPDGVHDIIVVKVTVGLLAVSGATVTLLILAGQPHLLLDR